MLVRQYTNCLNFEHTFLLTEDYVEYPLAISGFSLVKKRYFKTDHSIFFHAVRTLNAGASPLLPQNLGVVHRDLYLNYVRFHEDLVLDLNRRLLEASGEVYLFGAHVFSQYLIAFGLDTSRIVGILDNDPAKQGKRLYGSGLRVFSPEVLRNAENVSVVLRAGVYTEEIRDDIVTNINPECLFVE